MSEKPLLFEAAPHARWYTVHCGPPAQRARLGLPCVAVWRLVACVHSKVLRCRYLRISDEYRCRRGKTHARPWRLGSVPYGRKTYFAPTSQKRDDSKGMHDTGVIFTTYRFYTRQQRERGWRRGKLHDTRQSRLTDPARTRRVRIRIRSKLSQVSNASKALSRRHCRTITYTRRRPVTELQKRCCKCIDGTRQNAPLYSCVVCDPPSTSSFPGPHMLVACLDICWLQGSTARVEHKRHRCC